MSFLIDGHNLIGAMPDLSLSDPDDEQALVLRLHVFAQRTRESLAVVFDPGELPATPARPQYGDVKVAYARRGGSADDLIVRRLRAARRPAEITVVTSDLELSRRARAAGARVMPAGEFLRLMAPANDGPTAAEQEDEERANLHLGPQQVEEWMEVFRKRRRR